MAYNIARQLSRAAANSRPAQPPPAPAPQAAAAPAPTPQAPAPTPPGSTIANAVNQVQAQLPAQMQSKPQGPDLAALRDKFLSGQRARIDRDTTASRQQTEDALNRRFAALGQSGSGASIGASLLAQRGIDDQRNAALEGLAGQEAGMAMQQADVERQQGNLDRDMLLKSAMFDVEQGNAAKQYELALKQFELDKDTTAFNRRMAEIEAGRAPPGLLDSIGLPGVRSPFAIGPQSIGIKLPW